MLWIHYVFLVSYLSECRENRPATVREIAYILRSGEGSGQVVWNTYSGPGHQSPLTVNQCFRLLGPVISNRKCMALAEASRCTE